MRHTLKSRVDGCDDISAILHRAVLSIRHTCPEAVCYPLLLAQAILTREVIVVQPLKTRAWHLLAIYDDGVVAANGLTCYISRRVEALIVRLRAKDVTHISVEDRVVAAHHIPLVDGNRTWQNLIRAALLILALSLRDKALTILRLRDIFVVMLRSILRREVCRKEFRERVYILLIRLRIGIYHTLRAEVEQNAIT